MIFFCFGKNIVFERETKLVKMLTGGQEGLGTCPVLQYALIYSCQNMKRVKFEKMRWLICIYSACSLALIEFST